MKHLTLTLIFCGVLYSNSINHDNIYLGTLEQPNHSSGILLHDYILIGISCFLVILYILDKHKNAQFIEENRKRIEKLEEESQDTRNALKEQSQKQAEITLCINKQAETGLDKCKTQADFLSSDIYKLFKKQACSNGKMTITANDWKLLEAAINNVYKGFSEKLHGIHNFSEQEFRICLLIKACIPPVDVAKLTNSTKSAISATRRRLYKKIFHAEGNPQDMDRFIFSL